MSTADVSVGAPWRAGFRSARANLIPGLFLQLVALALVTAYYQHEPTRIALNRLAGWREQVGAVFAIISTAIFGGVLPALYLWAVPETRARFNVRQAAAITVFWAYKGLEVDILYRVLAHVVGSAPDVRTIAIKMTIDQFIYGPFFAVPVTVVIYEWVEANFDTGALLGDVKAGSWFNRRVLPLLISNLWVWLPTVCIIYSLPTPLQLPLQNLVLLFFTLLLAHLSRRASHRTPTTAK
ncbi:MAG: hypothetical protein ABIV50_13295 [Opitutus sp.]